MYINIDCWLVVWFTEVPYIIHGLLLSTSLQLTLTDERRLYAMNE